MGSLIKWFTILVVWIYFPKHEKRVSCDAIKLHSSFWETTAKRKDYLHWQANCRNSAESRTSSPLTPPRPFLSQQKPRVENKIHDSRGGRHMVNRAEVVKTHRWSTKVNLPSIAQRVTNSAGLTLTSLEGWWDAWGRRRHTVTRQVRFEVSFSVSPSESSWLLGQLRMYPVQWRVQYL